MAEDDATDQNGEEQEPKKGAGRKYLILAAVFVIVAAGGAFAYRPVMNMISPPEEPEDGSAAEIAAEKTKPALYAPLNPPLLINIKDSVGDAHFLQVTLDVMSRDQAVVDEVRNHATVIRNALILMWGTADYDFIQTREGKERMLTDARDEIARIVEAETGKTGVEAVFFTSLIIQ